MKVAQIGELLVTDAALNPLGGPCLDLILRPPVREVTLDAVDVRELRDALSEWLDRVGRG